MPNQSLELMNVDDKLSLINSLIDTNDYDVAVKESCLVFEVLFRKIAQKALASLPFRDRADILQAEEKIGRGTKGIEDFGFGELVGLFRQANLLDKWSTHNGIDMGLIKSLDFSSIVNLRNQLTHQGSSCSAVEANIVFEYLRNFLAVLGYADLDSTIKQSFREPKEETVQDTEETEELSLSDRLQLPKINKTNKGKSTYSSSLSTEGSRLREQGENIKAFDLRALTKVIDLLDGKKELTVLDLGCADGYVTHDRFSEFADHVKTVIGVDYNDIKINEANEAKYNEEIFSFHCLDVEDSQFNDKLTDILDAEAGEKQFDIIFSALTIHHVNNPLRALMKLRHLLKDDGYIILRGSDDGSKLGYPDPQYLIDNIINLSLSVQGVSDRENGRKIYNQLKRTGFKEVNMLYSIKDTANKSTEQRLALFNESFSYRINYFAKQLERDPTNKTYQQEHDWMKEALEELEIHFLDDAFLYTETDYIAIAKK